ncbi:Sec-independent protein translocase protein TatC [uncultured Desulfobacterium sp.]|uniref:Sec-independent protein translocase protein TatC n=1 Tax=uncultured Desulfobacterium sp. TaxID=201089 RepID=A0A445MTQ7_9BACT|nr:Sec-independent protein translocase protein TatC [uncultured Desulfobacterium sp.]
MDSHKVDEKNPKKIILFLESFRRSLIRTGIVIIVLSSLGYFLAEQILKYLYEIGQVQLASFTLPETFITFITIALAFGLTAGMPYILYTILSALPPLFESISKKTTLLFLTASILLFYSGMTFCIRFTLRYGIKFLLGFQTADIQAVISVKKYVSFCLFFIFGFGIIFLLPLAMMLVGRIGLVHVKTLSRYRRYAILIIAIISAILTPTPDVFNMSLMGVPLYILYELGLLGMRVWKPAG